MRKLLANAPWTWSVGGAILTLAAAAIGFGPQTAANMISSGSPFVVFMVLVGLGQMLVITTGPGNIDLSVPAVMALAGAIAMHVMAASGSSVWGILAALAVGIATGVLNYLLIRLLRIPPIIATLSSSFIWQSVAISQGQGNAGPPAAFENWVLSRYLGLSSLMLIGVAISVFIAIALFKMVIGRQLSAVGQNARAAKLAGVRVEPLRCGAYIACSVLAAIAALLLATFSGGATLDMGTEYMLLSVAVVVIGGTRISGGGAVPGGVWGASCFLYLLNAVLSASSAGAGARAIIYGGLIILVTFVAGTKRKA